MSRSRSNSNDDRRRNDDDRNDDRNDDGKNNNGDRNDGDRNDGDRNDRKKKDLSEGITSSLLIKNLSNEINLEKLREVCEKYGIVKDVYIPVDHYTKRPKSFAFVEFENQEAANTALDALNNTELAGKVLEILIAKTGRKSKDEMKSQFRGNRDDGRRHNDRDSYRRRSRERDSYRRSRSRDRGHDRRDYDRRDYDRRDYDRQRSRSRDRDRRRSTDRDDRRDYERRDERRDERRRSRSRDYERRR